MPSSKILFASLLAILSASCSNNRNANDAPRQTERSGNTLVNFDPKYIDDSPSLSANGTKIAFVSGRNAGVSRVFTMTRTTVGTAFSGLTQLSTNTGLTTEDSALLSPDGNYILVLGTNETGRGLVLCNFAGTSCTLISSSTIANNPLNNRKYAFSPDSALLSYLSESGVLSVAAVNAPTTTSTISNTSSRWLNAFWLPVASGYNLVGIESSTTVGKVNFVANTFSSAATASSATKATLITDAPNKSFVDAGPLHTSGSASRFLVFRSLSISAANMKTEIGNILDANKKKVPIEGELHSYSSSGSDEGILTVEGVKVLSGYLGADNDTVFAISGVAGRCDPEPNITYGTTITVSSISAKTSNMFIFKQLDTKSSTTQQPVLASNFCDLTINSVVANRDLTLRSLVVNPGATASAYSMAWVSTRTIDSEVYVADLVNGTTTITPVSVNYIP